MSNSAWHSSRQPLAKDHDVSLVCVDPIRADEIWPHVSKLMERAFWSGIGDDTVQTVKDDVDAGRSLLWIIWDNVAKLILAAVTTKIVSVPTKKLCVVTSCSGSDMKRWIGLISEIEAYAKKERCDAVRIMGRIGWKSVLNGYHEPWICLQKSVR